MSKCYLSKTLLLKRSTLQSQISQENILLSDNIVYQFSPTDSYKALKRFYNHWDPKTEFFFEFGIWLLGVSEVKKYTTSINYSRMI